MAEQKIIQRIAKLLELSKSPEPHEAGITYEQARSDHEYLWSIAPADDMSGGYVDQYDLCALLRNPTKIMARNCYINQIKYWFQVGPDHISGPKFRSADRYIETDRRVAEIATLYANIEVYTPRELC